MAASQRILKSGSPSSFSPQECAGNTKSWGDPLRSGELASKLDSIAASLFVLNWSSRQIVSDDKIQLTILILIRGALSRKDDREDEVGRRANLWDYQVETGGL